MKVLLMKTQFHSHQCSKHNPSILYSKSNLSNMTFQPNLSVRPRPPNRTPPAFIHDVEQTYFYVSVYSESFSSSHSSLTYSYFSLTDSSLTYSSLTYSYSYYFYYTGDHRLEEVAEIPACVPARIAARIPARIPAIIIDLNVALNRPG